MTNDMYCSLAEGLTATIIDIDEQIHAVTDRMLETAGQEGIPASVRQHSMRKLGGHRDALMEYRAQVALLRDIYLPAVETAYENLAMKFGLQTTPHLPRCHGMRAAHPKVPQPTPEVAAELAKIRREMEQALRDEEGRQLSDLGLEDGEE